MEKFTTAAAMAVFGFAALTAADATAARQRTFVASYGSDANLCTLIAPCHTFAPAVVQTLEGGEVVVLDGAEFGPVTITQSISIIAPRAVHAGIAVASGTGIVINAPGKSVRLEGISLEASGGAVGVRVDDAELVLIERCTITGFSNAVSRASAAASKIFIHDTTIRDSGVGIYTDGATKTVVDHSRLEKNSGAGMRVGSDSLVTIANSVIARNGTHGVLIQPTAGTASTAIVGTSIVENGGDGVHASAAGASIVTLSLSKSELRRNASGLAVDAVAGATIGMDVEDSALSDHANAGISTSNVGGTVKVTISGITLTGNGTGVVNSGALIESRGNNTFNYNGANGGPFTALPGV